MTFKNEYEYLIHLLCCAVHDTVPEDVPENISLEKVLEYGTEHEVANIAFLAVEKLTTPPDITVFNRFRQEYFKAAKRDVAQKRARTGKRKALYKDKIFSRFSLSEKGRHLSLLSFL